MESHPIRRPLHIRETIATLIAEEKYFPWAEAAVCRYQDDIRQYIDRHPEFRHSLEPLDIAEDAPPIVRSMADATRRMKVGPMAAVAGAIAQFVVNDLVQAGATHIVFDNGGDIVMKIDRPVVVGIFTGPAKIKNLGLRFDPRPVPFSLCTSSGTVGHSLSFGIADAATVVAADGCLADAAATALGNRIKHRSREEIAAAIDELLVEGIEGMLVVADDKMGMGGRLEKIVRVPVDVARVSRA